MSMPEDIIFDPGDRVISFRKELATVVGYRVVDDPSKSDRVRVRWDGARGDDPVEYYAGVFNKVGECPDCGMDCDQCRQMLFPHPCPCGWDDRS